MPIMLVAIIYLTIWVAVPTYSDPGGIVDIKIQLQDSGDKLADVDMRISNAKKLANELSQNSQEQKILFQYLPDKKLNEDIVASLNAMASKNEVAITGLSFKDSKDKALASNEDLTVTAKDSLELNKSMDSPKNVAPKKSSTKNFNTNVTLVGDYEKIRNFIVSLSALKRFNGIEMVEINKKDDVNFLEAKIDIRLNYLDKLKSIAVVDKEMFKDGKFDMSIANEISTKTNVDITKVGVDSAGRTNPFVL